jgi:hypothetical protein
MTESPVGAAGRIHRPPHRLILRLAGWPDAIRFDADPITLRGKSRRGDLAARIFETCAVLGVRFLDGWIIEAGARRRVSIDVASITWVDEAPAEESADG